MQEDITVQLKFTEGEVVQTADGFGSDLCSSNQNNRETYPTQLSVPGSRGFHGEQECNGVRKDAARRYTGD